MLRGSRFNRLTRWSLVMAVLLPAGAQAVPLPAKHHGPLSPDLRRLAEPSLSEQSPIRQAMALGLPAVGPGSLIHDSRRVLVDIRFDVGARAQLDAVRSHGASIAAVSGRYQTVTAAVPPDALGRFAALPGVSAVTAVPAPIVFAEQCEGGSVISEGVTQINSKAAREEFALDGEGVTVGVLSDSYDKASEAATNAPEDVASADLPGITNPCLAQKPPVDVRREFSPSEPGEATDEGR